MFQLTHPPEVKQKNSIAGPIARESVKKREKMIKEVIAILKEGNKNQKVPNEVE